MHIWVTGIGVVSPLGLSREETMDRLVAGERGIGRVSLFSLEGARSTLAAEVKGLTIPEGCSRTDALALTAAREAMHQAKVGPHDVGEMDIIVGGTTAGMFETEELLVDLDLEGERGEDTADRLRTHPLSSTVDKLQREIGPFRSTRTLCCACTSGAAALALGASWLSTGRAKWVLAGGADALCRLTYSGFGALGVLDPIACRPFDRTRAGLTLGEGAAFLVLERDAHARARGVEPLAIFAGWGMRSEAHHITNPQPGGATGARIIASAIERAGLYPSDIDYVNAHGTATPNNDTVEASALKLVFGDRTPSLPVSSSKGQIGHTLGASGAIEAAVTIMAISRGMIPPTAGLETPDEGSDLLLIKQSTPAPLRTALSSSFGFGGTGACLVFARPDAAPLIGDAARRKRDVVVTGAAAASDRGVLRANDVLSLISVDVGSAGPDRPIANELDAARSRRMDHAGKLVTAVTAAALDHADVAGDSLVARSGVATLSGTAFGSVDGSMKFMKRVLERGAKLASPADFPNLVPSSPVSHASIYLGLEGPAMAVPDLSATAESGMLTGIELVEGGEAESSVAGSAEEVSRLAERVLAPLLGVRPMGSHSEGASAVVFESVTSASARGATPLASVLFAASSRGASPDWRHALPPPVDGASVVFAEVRVDLETLLDGTSWANAEVRRVARNAGDHVGLGGVAFACAVMSVARGLCIRALVIGQAPDRSYAFVLDRVREPS